MNEQLVELPYEYRLLFIGLWTLADREGRLENRPKKIKMQLFPCDDIDIPSALLGLAEKKLVTLYAVDNIKYVYINNFLKHQHPHCKEVKSMIPSHASTVQAPDKPEADPSESLILNPESLIPIKEGDITSVPEDELAPVEKIKVPFKEIVELYHKVLTTLPRMEKLTDVRKGLIRQRWLEDLPDLNNWENYFDYISQSEFLMGKVESYDNRPPFRADLEWISRPSNYAKILEEKYHGEVG